MSSDVTDDRFRELVVTLDEQIHAEHGEIKTFRAVERCEYDDRTQFFGVNVGNVSVIEVARDNVRSVVYEREEVTDDD